MISGRDTFQVIHENISQVRSETERNGKKLLELNERINRFRFEEAEQYRNLAKFRLDKALAENLITGLEKSDLAIMALLEKKNLTINKLDQDIKKNIAKQDALEDSRKVFEKKCDDAMEAIENRLAKTQKLIEKTDAYRDQKEKVTRAIEIAKKADEKASRSEKDRAHKGKPYEDDTLFMYLWKRHFLTPDYDANRIARSLDGWVAGLINYMDLRPNYHMLTELPVRLRDHAVKVKNKADAEIQILREMERKAAEKDGVPELQSNLFETEKKLEQIDTEIEQIRNSHQSLLAQQGTFFAWTDEDSKKAIQLQVAVLEKKEMADLYHQARTTPTPDDDVIVTRLNNSKEEMARVKSEIRSVKEEQRQLNRSMVELEKLRNQFRRNHYDTRQSTFPNTLGLALLLRQLMKGSKSGETVWGEIKRSQRFERPSSPRTFGDGGFGSNTGFRTGGGFGGGGFGNTGGFRTGGGF